MDITILKNKCIYYEETEYNVEEILARLAVQAGDVIRVRTVEKKRRDGEEETRILLDMYVVYTTKKRLRAVLHYAKKAQIPY